MSNNIITPHRRSIKSAVDLRAEKCLKEVQAVLNANNCVIISRTVITGGMIDGSQYLVMPKEYLGNK